MPKDNKHKCSRDAIYHQKMEERLKIMRTELLDMAYTFCKEEVENTIVFFGSSRTLPEAKAKKNLEIIKEELDRSPDRPQELIDRFREAEFKHYMSLFYNSAEELAFRFSQWSQEKFTNPLNQFIVCSGGGPGIMEATNRGAQRANSRSIGLNIQIPTEQSPNPYISPELSFNFKYFFLRKFWFFYFAKAFVVFPGGMGTLDEVFELITLVKTGRMKRYVPIVLFGSKYWRDVINFEPMIQHGAIKRGDVDCFIYSDDVDETFRYITAELEKHYPPQH